MRTNLLGTREPTAEESGADIVFLRHDLSGNLYAIQACTCYESWEQWGQPKEILGDNVDDVEAWRQGVTNDDE